MHTKVGSTTNVDASKRKTIKPLSRLCKIPIFEIPEEKRNGVWCYRFSHLSLKVLSWQDNIACMIFLLQTRMFSAWHIHMLVCGGVMVIYIYNPITWFT